MQENPLRGAELQQISSIATSAITRALPRRVIVTGVAPSTLVVWLVVLQVQTDQEEEEVLVVLVALVDPVARADLVVLVVPAVLVVPVGVRVALEALEGRAVLEALEGPAGLVVLVALLQPHHQILVTCLFLHFQIQSYPPLILQQYHQLITHITEERIGFQKMFEPGQA